MNVNINWKHVASYILTVAPIAIPLVHRVAQSWYHVALVAVGGLWSLLNGSIVDPGVIGQGVGQPKP